MIQSATQRAISDIFGIDAKVKYVIPRFQREYVWGKEQWDNLFSDLTENDKGHFLGSIICINRATDALGVLPLEVIDGQQRLTTISLMYAAIYSLLSAQNPQDDDTKNEIYNLRSRLIQKGQKDELKIELSEQKSNHPDYKSILRDIGLLPSFTAKLANVGNRRISKTFQYLKERLAQKTTSELIDILDRINSALIVKIEVNSHSDAFVLFESLNNRGIPLSAIDLIKNNILAQLERKNLKPIDTAFSEWINLVDNLPDYTVQERFLRQYYNAFKFKDTVSVTGISKATRSNLIRIYDTLIDKNPLLVFEELISKSGLYNQFVEPEGHSLDPSLKNNLNDLSNIGAAPSYTFLLYLFSRPAENPQLKTEVVSLLIRYFVRRNVTDFPATRDLDSIFIELIGVCEQKKQNLGIVDVRAFLTDPKRFSPLETFRDKISSGLYEENVDAARFLLSHIEQKHSTRENSRNLWERDQGGKLKWSIEHIFPEGERIPKDWVAMIADGNLEKAKQAQEEFCHRLGNLTLSAYNSKLFNYPFGKKRDLKDDNGNYIGYKNGLYLNEDIKGKEKWSVDDIKARTAKLVAEAVDLFKETGE